MRVQLIDPSGDVLPYDHALASALARRGADVELVTSRFVHGPSPTPDGYALSESFYRLATRLGAGAPGRRRALKLLEHVPDMLRYRRRAARADLRHYQWLPLERLDALLLPPARPRVLTMHNVIRRERVDRRLVERMDAVIVHTRRGAELLNADRVHVVPHGAFEHLTRQPEGRPLGVSMERLRRLAPPGRVRFVERYVSDAEQPAFFRRAELLVLPHRSVDVSGVLFAGLAFGKAMVLSDVGGFTEVVEDHGAGRLVPPGDSSALAAAIRELLARPRERALLEERAAAAAAGPYSWDRVAERTLSVYDEVLG